MSHKIFRPIIVLFLVIGLVFVVQGPLLARAAGPWYVTPTGNDNNDCLSPSTPCATINGALSKAIAGDTVNVSTGTYTGSGVEIVLIDKDITLSGGWDSSFSSQVGNSSIDGESARRGIQVNSNVSVIIEHFNILNGTAGNAGGILSFGNVIFNGGVISNSIATGTFGLGGGLVNDGGTFILNNSLVSNNGAIGQRGSGGGILNNGTLELNNVMVIGNQTPTGNGAGIFAVGGTVKLVDSSISNNMAPDGAGGGLYLQTPVEIFSSTINNNEVFGPGAGVYFDGIEATISNSTISGNISTSDINRGGGLYISTGDVTISNSTISANSSQNLGGGIFNSLGTLTIQNSIIFANIAPNGAPDCWGGIASTITSLGYNLIGDTTDCTFILGNGDITGLDPLLGPLQDNGGPTLTHALLPDSPAIDAGNPAGCTDQDGNLLTTDQRGITRPQGTACDIGAFELEIANPIIEVSLDIKPGSETNPINTKSKGKIPVAILSTADFDAPSMVDVASLTFGKTGDEVSLAFCNNEDINGDDFADLVCHFYTQSTGFQIGDTEGMLKGQTMEGVPIEGSDNVKVLK